MLPATIQGLIHPAGARGPGGSALLVERRPWVGNAKTSRGLHGATDLAIAPVMKFVRRKRGAARPPAAVADQPTRNLLEVARFEEFDELCELCELLESREEKAFSCKWDPRSSRPAITATGRCSTPGPTDRRGTAGTRAFHCDVSPRLSPRITVSSGTGTVALTYSGSGGLPSPGPGEARGPAAGVSGYDLTGLVPGRLGALLQHRTKNRRRP